MTRNINNTQLPDIDRPSTAQNITQGARHFFDLLGGILASRIALLTYAGVIIYLFATQFKGCRASDNSDKSDKLDQNVESPTQTTLTPSEIDDDRAYWMQMFDAARLRADSLQQELDIATSNLLDCQAEKIAPMPKPKPRRVTPAQKKPAPRPTAPAKTVMSSVPTPAQPAPADTIKIYIKRTRTVRWY